MNAKDIRILRRRKRELARRLKRKPVADQGRPMFRAQNIRYEMAERTRAIDCGGIGAFHVLAHKTGLIRALDEKLHLLKQHKPYHESDHVLNIAYNTLTGGTCLDDIELRRNDETYMDALGAERIPDPTTAGDFSRRFSESDVRALMEAVNGIRVKVWKKRLTRADRAEAILDVDGTLAPTTGECKGGMGLSYKGVWGYHPLVVSLANTMEPLYLVNRSGNRPSHDGAAAWIDRAVALVRQAFRGVTLRGDTDFSLTAHFDRWTGDGVRFAFGIDAMPNLVERAESLENTCWKPLSRRAKRMPGAARRARPENIKEQIVIARKYKNVKLEGEHVAEFSYRPTKCRRAYRVIVLRKDLAVSKGTRLLFKDFRYFFYITNIAEMSPAAVVGFCNERCNQENLIDQLKNGLNALRMPVGDLVSNWAYMVMASLAWTLKAWFALQARRTSERWELLRMEFKRFLNAMVRLPCQIVRTGRRIVYRILGYNRWTRSFLQIFRRIRELPFT
ncbi:MAG: IS1380 family transposase [Candidatus Hydrogenedentes bacterium]|nr:IS1380 family transposase [Candidatus Hydrogenedentota bacterium]